MGKINLAAVDDQGNADRQLRTRAREKHSGWMSANRAGRTSSLGDVCPVLPRRSIQMKDDPGLKHFGRRRQFSKLRYVALDDNIRAKSQQDYRCTLCNICLGIDYSRRVLYSVVCVRNFVVCLLVRW